MVFPKRERLSKSEVAEILKSGKSKRGPLFVLRYKRGENEVGRRAFVVGKKVSKKAVERNRIRRRLAEAVKKNISQKLSVLDLVFVVLPEIAQSGARVIEQETRGFIKRNF